MARQKQTARTTLHADRVRQALQLRMAGLDFFAIGQRMGVVKSQAWKLVDEGLRQARAEAVEVASELRDMELARLDRLWTALWQEAIGRPAKGQPGDADYQPATDADPAAVDRLLKISAQRCKLLGIDAPERLELTGAGGGPLAVTEVEIVRLPDNGR